MRTAALAMIALGCGTSATTAPDEPCDNGVCVCAAGLGDCDGNTDNGCESDLNSSADNCGACGRACANGHCEKGCVCNAFYGDCDSDPENGCEVSLAQDPKHCGRCDHDCGGGSCAGGVCQPLTLAAALSEPQDLSLGDGHAFWVEADRVAALPLSGGAQQPLVLETAPACAQYHDGRVYYLVAGAVRSIALGEAQPTTLTSAVGPASVRPCLFARAGHVYWIEGNADLREAPATGGGSSLVAQDVHALTADDQHYYWSQLDTVFQAPHDGSPAGPIAFEAATALATYFGDVFWLLQSGVIRKRSADPGPIDTVVDVVPSLPSTMAVDGSGIYAVLPADGSIVRFRHQDGGLEVLATQQTQPRSIALDETHVYWLTSSALLRVAK